MGETNDFFHVDRTIFKRNILFVNCEKSSKQKKHKLKKKKKITPLATRTLAILQGKYSRVRTFNAIVVVVVHTSQVIWGSFLLQMLTLNEKKKCSLESHKTGGPKDKIS